MLAHCSYGHEKSNSTICNPTIKEIDVPLLGKCFTVNADSEFGKVNKVGAKRGLRLALNMKNFERNSKKQGQDDVGLIKVSLLGFRATQ